MIAELIASVGAHIQEALSGRLSMVRRVQYGPAQSVSAAEYPAILYNLLECGEVVGASSAPAVEVRFGLYLCTAILGDREDAALAAQSLLWSYEGDAPHDRGLLPWLIEVSRRQWLRDSRGRVWRMTMRGAPRVYADTVGPNIRGAVYAEISLQTRLEAIA